MSNEAKAVEVEVQALRAKRKAIEQLTQSTGVGLLQSSEAEKQVELEV